MIDILLPVYNGDKYLEQQIDSIISQSYEEWHLLIRNDGSTDYSQKIIQSYIAIYPDKIINVKGPLRNIGLVESINVLLAASTSEYIMFADQDDLWMPNKIEISLTEIRRIETPGVPALVCTDAICVDNNMNILSDSFFESSKFIRGIVGNKYKMLALNEIQGCTIIMNRDAKNYVYPIPSNVMKIHDMWLGVVVAHYGTTKYLHRPTLYYRQHSGNVLGSNNVGLKYFLNRFKVSLDTLKKRRLFFKELPFHVNMLKWVYLKCYYAIKRMF